MVNDNAPPVASIRDSVSTGESKISTPTSTSVDLSSKHDSDIALNSKAGSTPTFLNNLTIQMDQDADNIRKDGPYKPNPADADNIRKDGPYKPNPADDNNIRKDGPYKPADHGGEATQPIAEPGNENSKPPKDSIRNLFPELAGDSDPKGKNPIGSGERDQTPGRKGDWRSGPQAIGLAPKDGSFNPQPIGLAPSEDHSPHPDSGGKKPGDLIPNGNHPPGGGGDNTGGGGDGKPQQTPESEQPRDTSDSGNTKKPNRIAPERERKTANIMARRHHMR